MFLCHPFPLRAESMGEGLCYVMPWWEGEVEVLRWPQLMAPVYLLLALRAFVAFFLCGCNLGYSGWVWSKSSSFALADRCQKAD